MKVVFFSNYLNFIWNYFGRSAQWMGQSQHSTKIIFINLQPIFIYSFKARQLHRSLELFFSTFSASEQCPLFTGNTDHRRTVNCKKLLGGENLKASNWILTWDLSVGIQFRLPSELIPFLKSFCKNLKTEILRIVDTFSE